nr:ribonuclease H-like domain-containing protein [Tanacetum cinerariifolium]
MDSLSPQVVSAAKLPILNPNEFNLWKTRIEQYFLMNDYSLWEVILNGDSPVPTRIVEGVLQPVAPITAEQKLARKNKLKARGTFLMALHDKHQLKFNSHKDAKTLMEALEKSITESLSAAASVFAICVNMPVSSLPNVDSLSNAIDVDDLKEMDLRWQMAMLTMRARRFLQKTGRNLGANGPTSMGFDMSKVKCYNCHMKGHFAREYRSLKDSRRNSATEPQRRTVPVKTSTSIILNGDSPVPTRIVEGVLQPVAPITAKQKLARKNKLKARGTFLMALHDKHQLKFNSYKDAKTLMEAIEKRKGYFARECRSLKDSRRNSTAEPQRRTVPVETSTSSLESVEARLLVYKQNESVFEENNKLLNIKVQLRDNALVTLRQKLEKAELERDDLKLKFQPSNGYHAVPPSYTGTFMPPKPDLVFNTAPTTVETDHPTFTTKAPQIVPSFVQSSKQVKSPRHSIQYVETTIPVTTPKPASPKLASSGKRRNRKACFVCKSVDHLIKDCDYHAKKMAQPTPRNHPHRGNHKQYAPLTHTNPQKNIVPAAVLTQSKQVSITAVRPVSPVVPKFRVTQPRQAKPFVTKSKSPIKRYLTHSQSLKTSNSPPKITVVKAPVGNPQHALKDKGVIDSRCLRYMTGNMSYLSDFKELNGGYVAFRGNLKGGKISRKGKIKTGKLDFDDVYFVKELKFNLFSVLQMCDKKNSVLFTNTECLVLSLNFKLSDESQVLLRVPRENNMYNVNLKNIVPSGDLTCLFAKAIINESYPQKFLKMITPMLLVRKESNIEPLANLKGKLMKDFWLDTLKVIRSDKGTEFKNNDLNQFYGIKGIKREFNVPRTPQQNGIVERKNRTLIEAARTMLADSLLLIPF